MARAKKTRVTAKKEAVKPEEIKQEEKVIKVKVKVLKGFAKEFNSDKIKEGSILNLQKKTAAKLLLKGYVSKV